MKKKDPEVEGLLSLLYEYKTDDLSEENDRKETIYFLENNDNCFERSSLKGHLTASAWVLDSSETHILLIHHKKLDMWLQLVGHADGDKNLLRVSMKEVLEESGLKSVAPITDKIFDIGVHKIPKYKSVEEHYHYDVRFLLKSTCDDVLVKNEESNDIRWFRADHKYLPTQNSDVVRMLSKCLKYKNELLQIA
jgi:hypothetical protein